MNLSSKKILLKLARAGFKIRSFLSADGSKIFSVLYSCDDNLKKAAEKEGLTKSLNLEFTDLLSLEPVDKAFRPLRLNNRLWKPEEYKGKLTPFFVYIRPKVIELLDQINFKLIARECNLSQMNQQLFRAGQEDILHDYYDPTDDEWSDDKAPFCRFRRRISSVLASDARHPKQSTRWVVQCQKSSMNRSPRRQLLSKPLRASLHQPPR